MGRVRRHGRVKINACLPLQSVRYPMVAARGPRVPATLIHDRGRNVNDYTDDAAVQPETEVLDEQALDTLRRIASQPEEAAFVHELVGRFLNDTPERIARMREALRINDHDSLALFAHTLKSSCGFVGASAMVRQCEALEAHARHQDPDAATSALRALEASYEAACAPLRELRGE